MVAWNAHANYHSFGSAVADGHFMGFLLKLFLKLLPCLGPK